MRPAQWRMFSEDSYLLSKLNTSKSNVYLMQIYNTQKLSIDQRFLMLKYVLRHMNKVKEILHIYNTTIGCQFVRDVIRDSKTLPPERNSLVLNFLSKPTKKLLLKVVAMEDIRYIVTMISNEINNTTYPLETIQAYRDTASLEIMNYKLEVKTVEVLKSYNENITLKMMMLALEGAAKVPRHISCDIVEMVAEKSRFIDWNSLIFDDLVKTWQLVGIARHRYHIAEDFFSLLSEKVSNLSRITCMKSLVKIQEYMITTQSFDKRLMEKVYKSIQAMMDNDEYFIGDTCERFVMNLLIMKNSNFEISFPQEIASELMILILKLNEVGRIKDLETFTCLNVLFSLTKTMPALVENKMTARFNSKETIPFFKFVISIILSTTGNLKMGKIAEDYCKETLKHPNYTFSTYLNLYYLISDAIKVTDSIYMKNLTKLIEDHFSSSIVDFESFRFFYYVAELNKKFISNTSLWEKYTLNSIKAIKSAFDEKLMIPERLLDYYVFIYNKNLPIYKEWKEVAESFMHNFTRVMVINSIFDKFNIQDAEAYFDLIMIRHKPDYFVLSHFLSMRVQNPSHSLLMKACSVLNNAESSFLIEPKMKLSRDSLLSHIFSKGYSKLISRFLNNIDTFEMLKEKSMDIAIKLFILVAQYSKVNRDRFKALKTIRNIPSKLNAQFNIALCTSFYDYKYEKKILEYFSIDETLEIETIIEKINLFLNFRKSFPEETLFLSSVLDAISSKIKSNPENMIKVLENLTNSYNNQEAYQKIKECLEDCFNNLDISELSSRELLKILLGFINLDGNPKIIDLLQEKLEKTEFNEDLLEKAIFVYKTNGRNNDFVKKLLMNAHQVINEKSLENLIIKVESLA